MATNHTIRQMIIDEDLPKLVKLLTGFNDDDENFKLCEAYAFSRVASHRFLSVNSHEVRRRIDGVAERFMADNYTQYGEKLKDWVQEFVNDPLCTNHYELDVQWSILNFLLEVSRNPVAALSGGKKAIELDDPTDRNDKRPNDRRRSVAMHELVNSLIQHNIPSIQEQMGQSADHDGAESDLSEWSDDEDEGAIADANSSQKSTSEPHSMDIKPLRLKLNPCAKEILRPPEKKSIFTEFDGSKAFEWRDKNMQPAWWIDSTPNSGNVTVISEWCMLRELIWVLFLEPFETETDAEAMKKLSKTFSLKFDTDEIVPNGNVTLSTTSVNALNTMLVEFARIATKLYRFQKFFKSVFDRPEANTFLETVQSAPHSIKSYAIGLKDFLRVVSNAICEVEIEIAKQDLTKTHTIIYLYNYLYPHFRTIDILYDLHTDVYIDFRTNAGHVCVAHLLAGLTDVMDTSATVQRLNMVASLFLVSIRFYLSVFSRWWAEGHFKDWCSEFLIEKCTNQNRLPSASSMKIYQARPIADGVSRSLDAASIEKLVQDCDIITLIREEALEAGYILNILYSLDKLSDMKTQQSVDDFEDIEEMFMKSFWEEISKFKTEKFDEDVACALPKEKPKQIDSIKVEKPETHNFLLEDLTGEADALLSMAFDEYMSITNGVAENTQQIDEDLINCDKMCERITDITDFPLPLTIIMHDCLRKILRSRISVANKYVLRIFLEEYKVVDHIINLQRVYFFGAGDLMHTFYSKLFQKINAGEDWNNCYLLTVHLDEVLSSRHPEMRAMFGVQVEASDSHTKETLSAITDITINYSVRDSIRDVIHERALTKYNEIFRFLLQVKWAIWTLETLQFPVAFKKRPPYQSLTLIDLIFKRLALVRNWIIYSVQCVHSHLMTFVIQSMGQQLVKRMAKTECLREIIELHDSYIDTIYQHCFRKTSDIPLRTGVEQLLSLVVVLRDEWNNLHNVNSYGDFVDGENQFDISGTVEQVDIIEATYINCHCHIAEVLTREVYSKNETALASLSAAFNCSCPY